MTRTLGMAQLASDPIWLPCTAMVLLTALVWVRLYVQRLGEMRTRRISPQSIATAGAAAGRLEQTNAADNFRNLFEIPVLFYLWCIAIVLTGGSTPALIAGAWAYAGLRALHSLIHVTYNRVLHRFLVHVASTLLLFGLWFAFLARIAA
jgi:hypothetical protein